MNRYPQGVLVGCVVPWDKNEQFLEGLFRLKVRHFLRLGFTQLYIFGTAGEGYAVDTARFRQVSHTFFEETCAAGIDPQVGIIGLSTAQCIERIELAYEIGFRTFQISLPSWNALNDREVLRFFIAVCGAFPDARFLHYNLGRTKRVLTGADYRRLADEVPNLVATKNTSPSVDHTLDLMRTCPELQHFLGEWTFPIGTMWGECSLLSSFAAMLPSKTLELYGYARAGRVEELFRAHKEYLSVVLDVIGPMQRLNMVDGAYDKLLVRLGGFDMPGRLLSPYDSFPEEVFEECREILHVKYPDWAPSPAPIVR